MKDDIPELDSHPMDIWEDYQYHVAVLDGDMYCDDDQFGVVLNACSQEALAHNH